VVRALAARESRLLRGEGIDKRDLTRLDLDAQSRTVGLQGPSHLLVLVVCERVLTRLLLGPSAREEMRSRERAQLEELEGLLRFDLSEEEMAPLLADRITGIRGRYRITGTWQEMQEGITAADIDAP
jgi:hypothetical protein